MNERRLDHCLIIKCYFEVNIKSISNIINMKLFQKKILKFIVKENNTDFYMKEYILKNNKFIFLITEFFDSNFLYIFTYYIDLSKTIDKTYKDSISYSKKYLTTKSINNINNFNFNNASPYLMKIQKLTYQKSKIFLRIFLY